MKKTLCQLGKGKPTPPLSLPFKFQIVTVELPSYSRKDGKETDDDGGSGDNAYGCQVLWDSGDRLHGRAGI